MADANKFMRPRRPVDPGAGGLDDIEGMIQAVHDAVKTRLEEERLHVPEKIEADVVELPFDLTQVSDADLQKLYSAFSAYSYRSGYLLLLEEGKEQKSKEAADEIVTAYIAAAGADDGSVTSIKAKAEQLPDVKAWRRRQHDFGVLASAQRKQRENYDKVCERLSRLETMRMNEYERGGNRLASRTRPTKGQFRKSK